MAHDPEKARLYHLSRKDDPEYKRRRYLAHRRYVERNRERIREYSKKQTAKRVASGKSKVATMAWEMRNPDKVLLRAAKQRAKRDGREFDIDLSDVVIPAVCPILGIEITPRAGMGRMFPNSPSLDRIDPALGYIKGNVWVISWKANRMKHDASPADLLTFARSVIRIFG
jgi:hypothetical protein